MAAKHTIAVCSGAVVGIAYVSIDTVRHGQLSGLEVALPQALAAIALVFNVALIVDLIRFESTQFGDLVHSRNTLIGGTFLVCFLAVWYIVRAFIALFA